MNADVLEKRERNGSKLQPQGTFIHNVGEQADQSVTWSCYAKHIPTLTENSLIQKIEHWGKNGKLLKKRERKRESRQTATRHERVNNHQMGLSSFTEKKTP